MKQRSYGGEMTMEQISGYINSRKGPFSILIPLNGATDIKETLPYDEANLQPTAGNIAIDRLPRTNGGNAHE